MRIKLFGVMGSISGGESDLGRNTTCLLLSNKDKNLILDSGTGILNYMTNVDNSNHHILLSHYHMDHILGFPFIPQLYEVDNFFNIYGPSFNGENVDSQFLGFMKEPYLPIKTEHILAKLKSTVILEGKTQFINGFEVEALKVEHPGGSFIYSIKAEGKKISFLADFPNGMDSNKNVIDFCSDSDLIYADAMFIEEELLNTQYLEYGHSCIESVIKFFKKTHSKKLLLGHHNIFRNYKDLKHYETKNIIIARENDEIDI